MVHSSLIFSGSYTTSFKLHQGSKSEDPQELTEVSDWGEQT
ncbi:addiction module toxin RelE [Lelliottia amnigena]|nr:addiction module toxin RelE [Lelliottia amnigena]PEG63300.1 addiction module toxin RelE [Lelliottia amnigena]